MYGSSRIGILNRNNYVGLGSIVPGIGSHYYLSYTRGKKFFELSNHLGNVLTVVSDRKKPFAKTTNQNVVDFYVADIKSVRDYYPFGMDMPGRKFTSSSYRYGFNGKEKDANITSEDYDYGMRIYDARFGRFLSVDPLTISYPMNTPYQFSENSPISGIDLDGEEFRYYLINVVQLNGKVVLIQPTFQRVENYVAHKVETIFGIENINFPRSQAWVANVGFYNYKFASYQAMQNAVDVLKDPETEKMSRECHCLPGVDLAYTVEAEERVGNFLQGVGNSAAAGVAVGDALKNIKVLTKQFSDLKRLGRTTGESVKKKLNDYLLNPEHPEGKIKAKWFKEALGFTKENAGELAKQIVFEESKAVKTVMSKFGQQYNQEISITGANGKKINVVFGFIKNEDNVVRMVTAIPTKQ